MRSHVFPRVGGEGAPVAVRGDGVFVIDKDGRRYLDGCGGAAVSCLGHSNAYVAKAIARQAAALAYAHTGFFTSEAAEELAAMLVAVAPSGLDRVYFLSGGSEAVEAALKLARQFHVARGEPARRLVVGRRLSYHGNTLGALAVGDNAARREMFAPLLFDGVHHVAPCHYWRDGRDGESPDAYGARLAAELEAVVRRLGEGRVAACIFETVVGATLGAVAAVPGYFARVREICDKYGIVLILDEVMCGMGRTGSWFACEREGVRPDVVCVAKGIGGGMQPLAAMLCGEAMYEAVCAAHGGFVHGHTYVGHITACAAGRAVLREIERRDLLANVRVRGRQLRALLRARLGGHPHVGDVRGCGLLVGVEFVAQGRTPFAPELKIYEKVKRAAFAQGLMVYAMGGCVDGARGDVILLAPPFVISEAEVAELVERLEAALRDEAVFGRGRGV